MNISSLLNLFKRLPVVFVDTILMSKKCDKLMGEKVLVVRLDGLGDFVLWIDAAREIVTFYKAMGKTVVLVANNNWATWAVELGIFDDVIAVNTQRFIRDPIYRYRLGQTVRAMGFSIALNPTYSREWLLGDSLICISGTTERVGFNAELSNIQAG